MHRMPGRPIDVRRLRIAYPRGVLGGARPEVIEQGVALHLLASALVAHVSLWTADPRLRDVALELGVSFD